MREEQAFAGIQCLDPSHFICGQFKVKDVEVFPHPIFMGRFGNHHHIALKQEAQRHLRSALAIPGANLLEQRRIEKVVPAF